MQKIALSFIFIFFVGCSIKTTPIYAVIKTPKIKLSDQGFIKEGLGYKEIIIYKSGVSPFKITIKNSFICLNNKCMDKEKFINTYLGKEYPSDFFDKILNKECIKGFFCKKYKDKILFKDKKKGIVIMIKELN
jgi:hypothetical protein